MMLLAPWALWFSAIGGAVVALYLLKIKRHRQVVPALEFWLSLVSQTQVRSLFQRLKRWLSMLLWLAIAACLVLALGNPIITFGSIKPQSIVVILDNSASMQTVEPDSHNLARFALALDALDDLTRRRPVSDEWLLIEAARAPRVAAAWTRDPSTLREAARGVRPHVGTADLPAAHKLASQLLEGKERPCVILLSDGGAGRASELAANDANVVFWPIGGNEDNLGIARLRVRAHRQLGTHHALIRVVNASHAEVQTRVVFELDGSVHSVEPAVVPADGVWEKAISFNAPGGGVLRATIDRPDALMADNEAYAILEPIKPAKVLLVSDAREAYFLERGLAAMEPLIDVEHSRTIGVAEYEKQATTEAADLVIFNNCAPGVLPASGALVFINNWPSGVPGKITGEMQRAEMMLARRDHALTQYLSLNAVQLARARQVELADRATVLAVTPGGAPLIFLVQQPGRSMLCLAFDVLDSDLPFRNAFPILLRNAVTWLVADQAAWVRDQYEVGDAIEPLRRVTGEVTEVRAAALKTTDEQVLAIPVHAGFFSFDKTDACGPLRFEIGNDAAYTAVNLSSENESRVRPDTASVDPAERLNLTKRVFGAVPWLALTCIALTLVGFEWLTYHFRWTE